MKCPAVWRTERRSGPQAADSADSESESKARSNPSGTMRVVSAWHVSVSLTHLHELISSAFKKPLGGHESGVQRPDN